VADHQRCPNCAPGYDCESGIYTPPGADTWHWEPDGKGGWVSAPRCQEPTCPDFGSFDFGEGTCPAEHATAPGAPAHDTGR
jgi:hypothetical protein